VRPSPTTGSSRSSAGEPSRVVRLSLATLEKQPFTSPPEGSLGDFTIEHLDLRSGRVTKVFREEGPFDHWQLAVSPDEESVLFVRAPWATSELMLVENFR
jgi:hypothetical protein